MTIMKLTLIDTGEDELEVRVETDSESCGTLAERYMGDILNFLSLREGMPEGTTIH
jgi:hypothetical protein